jgi:alkylation response protein AidB-like acyl-CoA dehydrogenase
MYLDLNRNLTESQIALREQTHRFAEEVLRPAAFQLDKMHPEAVIAGGSPLWSTLKEAYRQGYHARGFPEALGGTGLSGFDSTVVTEEIAWGSCDFAAALGVSTIPFGFLLGTGDPELIREFVVPFAQDRDARIIGCWAITEPNRGSDSLLFSTQHFRDPAINLEATARLDGDEWVLNGQKSAWVSNGTIATHALMNVSIDASRGMAGGGFCFIPLDRPGVTRGKPLDKLGQRALNQGQIFLEDVRIPRRYMLVGPEGYAEAVGGLLTGANAGMGTIFSAVARAAFEEALAYAKQRVQGGVPIAEHQLVQQSLFQMFTKVQAATGLSRAASAYNRGGTPAAQMSMASKVFCTQACHEVASAAVQIHGGLGLCKDLLVEKLLRDARASMIEDGNNEALGLAAARRLIDG